MNNGDLKERLRQISVERGGLLFGVCKLDELADDFHYEVREISKKLPYGISVGVPVSPSVMNTLTDGPNYLYKAHYQQINHILNDTAFKISQEIELLGYKALPIPASQIIKWKPMKAHLSHRVVAHKAGLGWRGKNNLLVSAKYGSKIRLVTILTNCEMPLDSPLNESCENCSACLKACPAGAIKENTLDFDLKACFKQVSEFARPENIGSYICGLCLKVCNGQKTKA